MVKDCPRCGLINPPTAERCDCGYEFASGVNRGSLLNERDKANNETNAEALRPKIPDLGGFESVIELIINGSNGLGALVAALAILVAATVSSAAQLGGWGVVLGFGILITVADLVLRVFVLRISMADRHTGSRFIFLPLWVWGFLTFFLSGVVFLALRAEQ